MYVRTLVHQCTCVQERKGWPRVAISKLHADIFCVMLLTSSRNVLFPTHNRHTAPCTAGTLSAAWTRYLMGRWASLMFIAVLYGTLSSSSRCASHRIISVAGLLTWPCTRHTWLGKSMVLRSAETPYHFRDTTTGEVESLIRDMPMVCKDV